jgi:hypothetical protein
MDAKEKKKYFLSVVHLTQVSWPPSPEPVITHSYLPWFRWFIATSNVLYRQMAK